MYSSNRDERSRLRSGQCTEAEAIEMGGETRTEFAGRRDEEENPWVKEQLSKGGGDAVGGVSSSNSNGSGSDSISSSGNSDSSDSISVSSSDGDGDGDGGEAVGCRALSLQKEFNLQNERRDERT
ncbi:hypothetical protein HZH66_012071 [Vespula vulgaris]|uniref:Uncharacterized protein n=1 Tax=Vespula vulgaris TaxID=7454 RepID=A0A834JBG8_VESVU|nr:hypothetical protein HZH66_012071 [Vespula vulgaris]